MVKSVEKLHIANNGNINTDAWFEQLATRYNQQQVSLLRNAYSLAQVAAEDHLTQIHTPCLQQGLAMAEALFNMHMDADTLAAALLYPSVVYADLHLEDVIEQLNPNIAELINGVKQMEATRLLHRQSMYVQRDRAERDRAQIDSLRKMLLAMVQDVRVVLIKLAEYIYILRHAKHLTAARQLEVAHEVMDIYAPLANRLGVGQLKWELEDLSFRYLEPDTYKQIAKFVDQRRIEREKYIEGVIASLRTAVAAAGVTQADFSGRAKHIYSIYRKMKKKDVDYSQIYDVIAVRILVPTVEDCYNTLSIVHSLWEPIPQEFDDYIVKPKPNGYKSLHTAVIGPDKKNVEIQIRTFAMHNEAELGVAAHWIYKEGAKQQSGYEQKIAWLRQILDWQKNLSTPAEQSAHQVFEDRVYVFTPVGEIVELANGATVLDFAYQVHTEVGHRCRGAKINGHIVTLTHTLVTGEMVEILTAKNPHPSRDWLNLELGYLKTTRARAKVHHWFKAQNYDFHVEEGQKLLEREVRRLNLNPPDQEALAKKLHFKSKQDMLAAVGHGDLRMGQIIALLESKPATEEAELTAIISGKSLANKTAPSGIIVQGLGNILTNLAKCCKPLPGESIVGYVTQGRGISIHRQDCPNISTNSSHPSDRVVEVQWGAVTNTYPADIFIDAYDRQGLVRDLTALLSAEKINIIALTTRTDKNEALAHAHITLEVPSSLSLSKILTRIKQIGSVIRVRRQGGGE
ncbi:GTP diphosphokinase [soil metagenome]